MLILGLGRVGSLVAQQAAPLYDVIYGTSRQVSPSSDPNIQSIPWTAVAESLLNSTCQHVLITTPPLDAYLVSSLTKELKNHLLPSSWIGIISTTSVYGDHQGTWVTESSPCFGNPDYLAWEQQWQDFGEANNFRVRIFRCAGIYGNTRSSLHTLYSKGMPSAQPASTTVPPVTNRIHEADLIAAVMASMAGTESPISSSAFEVYNLSDNEPASRQEVFEYALTLMEARGVAIPATCPPTNNSGNPGASRRASRRGSDIKRVCNHKMRQQLVPKLSFPTYKEGLADIVRQPEAPWNL